MSLSIQPKNGFLPLLAALLASFSINAWSGESPPTRKDAGKPGQGGELSGRLILAGASTMHHMMSEIGQRFSRFYPKVVVEVGAGGSRVGVDAARSGQADIGMVSRPLEASEEDLYAFPLGRDGMALIVHRDNPVRNLSKSQAMQIFTGKVSTWSQVGGPPGRINVLKAEEGRGGSELVQHYFGLRYGELRARIVPGDNPERIAAAKGDPSAITFASVGFAERAAAAGEAIKLLSIDGVQPSSKTVRSGDHQMSRPLILVVKGFPKGLTKAFLSFALSSQTTEIIRKHDFVPYLD